MTRAIREVNDPGPGIHCDNIYIRINEIYVGKMASPDGSEASKSRSRLRLSQY